MISASTFHRAVVGGPARERHLSRDVVFGWAQPAGSDDDFGTSHSILDRFLEAGIIVADNCFQFDLDTEPIEFFGEPETVGVGAIGGKKLRTDGNDFS